MHEIFKVINENSKSKIKRKNISTKIRVDYLEKLEVAKNYYKDSNPKITKYEIIEMALDKLYNELNIQECVLKHVVPVVVETRSYEVVKWVIMPEK